MLKLSNITKLWIQGWRLLSILSAYDVFIRHRSWCFPTVPSPNPQHHAFFCFQAWVLRIILLSPACNTKQALFKKLWSRYTDAWLQKSNEGTHLSEYILSLPRELTWYLLCSMQNTQCWVEVFIHINRCVHKCLHTDLSRDTRVSSVCRELS